MDEVEPFWREAARRVLEHPDLGGSGVTLEVRHELARKLDNHVLIGMLGCEDLPYRDAWRLAETVRVMLQTGLA